MGNSRLSGVGASAICSRGKHIQVIDAGNRLPWSRQDYRWALRDRSRNNFLDMVLYIRYAILWKLDQWYTFVRQPSPNQGDCTYGRCGGLVSLEAESVHQNCNPGGYCVYAFPLKISLQAKGMENHSNFYFDTSPVYLPRSVCTLKICVEESYWGAMPFIYSCHVGALYQLAIAYLERIRCPMRNAQSVEACLHQVHVV